jgi:hypothetical protein
MENDNKDENHVDDQENDMTNNSKEEEEKTVQNPPIENHDNSRNTEAMEGKLEQSQSFIDLVFFAFFAPFPLSLS